MANMSCFICEKTSKGYAFAVGAENPVKYYTCDEHREEGRAIAQKQFENELKFLECKRDLLVKYMEKHGNVGKIRIFQLQKDSLILSNREKGGEHDGE